MALLEEHRKRNGGGKPGYEHHLSPRAGRAGESKRKGKDTNTARVSLDPSSQNPLMIDIRKSIKAGGSTQSQK